MITTTRTSESTAATGGLLLAFELGQRSWKLGFTVGLGQRPRIRQIPAGAVTTVATEIERAKKRFGLAAEAPVTSCYEAGRDGFWLHRFLSVHRITNYVVDSSSIEVDRRARRAKTDRLDLAGLLSLLARYVMGDQRAWRVVRVPTVADEDARHRSRTLESVDAGSLAVDQSTEIVDDDAGAGAADRCQVYGAACERPALGRHLGASRSAGATDGDVEAA